MGSLPGRSAVSIAHAAYTIISQANDATTGITGFIVKAKNRLVSLFTLGHEASRGAAVIGQPDQVIAFHVDGY